MNQIPWVDELLWQWGAWVRNEQLRGCSGSVLGRMYKQKMRESKVWDEPATLRISGDDDTMLAVDRAIASLDKKQRNLIRWRYWHEITMASIAQRIHRSRMTANTWMAEAQQSLVDALPEKVKRCA